MQKQSNINRDLKQKMSLLEWLDHIQTIYSRSIDLNLDRPRRVLHRLDFKKPKVVITVAGTNGKGSTVKMLEYIYVQAGYSVGSYTSPHLIDYCERVRINSKNVSEPLMCGAFEEVEKKRGDVPLTFFEFGTLAALNIFSKEKVDICILEVGLGGRLDAVNIVDSTISVITSIDLDHQQWLGDTREKIGLEKAGILRYKGMAVISDSKPPQTVMMKLEKMKCKSSVLGMDYTIKQNKNNLWSWEMLGPDSKDNTVTSWTGECFSNSRANNTAGVLATVSKLNHLLPVKVKNMHKLGKIVLTGRQQFITGNVDICLDVAHNAKAVKELAILIKNRNVLGKTRAVFSLLADKDLQGIISEISNYIDVWYVAQMTDDRASKASDIEDTLSKMAVIKSQNAKDPKSVFKSAFDDSKKGDLVLVFGSFYLVGDILSLISRLKINE